MFTPLHLRPDVAWGQAAQRMRVQASEIDATRAVLT
jgi:hypothetical protein